MNKENNDGEYVVANAPHSPEGKNLLTYKGYRDCGGIINEADYTSALNRAKASGGVVTVFSENQLKSIAKQTGITLEERAGIDPFVLYGILRHDEAPPKDVPHHHGLHDNEVALETFRMLEDEQTATAIKNFTENIYKNS